jgi:hypothetical protein
VRRDSGKKHPAHNANPTATAPSRPAPGLRVTRSVFASSFLVDMALFLSVPGHTCRVPPGIGETTSEPIPRPTTVWRQAYNASAHKPLRHGRLFLFVGIPPRPHGRVDLLPGETPRAEAAAVHATGMAGEPLAAIMHTGNLESQRS